MRVLVTGGSGYIGSHTVKALERAGHEAVVVDDLRTGHPRLARGRTIHRVDLGDVAALDRTFAKIAPDAVIHFAASAYVGESVLAPRGYYRNNVVATLNLLDAMAAHQVGLLVFSSSCATYGIPDTVPIREGSRQAPINPYGQSKLICEQMARDVTMAEPLDCIALRYFNASGADREGELGEVHDPETHVLPLILQAAADPARPFTIFGDDYPTPDGTCIRDYLHVEDLASAHVAALGAMSRSRLSEAGEGRFRAYNLGTGRGVSVRELITAAEAVTGRPVSHRIADRRPGDPPELVADPGLVLGELGWRAQVSDLETIVSSAWSWLRSPNNPLQLLLRP